MQNHKISVIIPVYNAEKNLERCIMSIIKQTYSFWECILVDDGSQDRCPEICDDYAKEDYRIKVIHQENQGVSAARNLGIEEATGDIITFLDADDCLVDTALKLMNQNWTDDVDIVCYSYAEINDANEKIERRCFAQEYINFSSDIKYTHNILERAICEMYSEDKFTVNFGVVWSKCYRKRFLDEYHIRFSPKAFLSEDIAFMLKAISCTQKVAYYNNFVYLYYLNDNSISTRSYNGRVQDLVGNYIVLFEYVDEIKCINNEPNVVQNMFYYLALKGILWRTSDLKSRTEKKICWDFCKMSARRVSLNNKEIKQNFSIVDIVVVMICKMGAFGILEWTISFWKKIKNKQGYR